MTDDDRTRGASASGDGRSRRLVAIVTVVVALAGLVVLGGIGWPSSPTPGPTVADLDDDFPSYHGEEVELSGEVLDAETDEVEVPYEAGSVEVALEGAPPLEPGTDVTFEGEVSPGGTIRTDPASVATREPWEGWYMYAISAVGAALALVLSVNYWRVDAGAFAVVPRERPLLGRLRREVPDRG